MSEAETAGVRASGAGTPGNAHVDGLRRALLEVMERHVPRSHPVALIDWPTHFNVGDAAIALGELAALREGGWEIAYVSAHHDYDPERVRERIGPGGTVLLHGGGNLGDLYPPHQELRLRVLSDLRDRRVVQLPQTVHFEDEDAIEVAARAFTAHPDLTVLVRDRDSERFVAERLGCETALSPDSAFALGSLERRESPDSEVLVIARRDPESGRATAPPSGPGVAVHDWPLREPIVTMAVRAAATRAARRAARHTGAWSIVGSRSARGYELVSRRVLRSGVTLLSRGRVIVSDRLHAHILCLLLGIPHVIVDDRFGKLSSFHSAWPDDTPMCERAGGFEDAIDVARRLAE